jgi:hypothetical protein
MRIQMSAMITPVAPLHRPSWHGTAGIADATGAEHRTNVATLGDSHLGDCIGRPRPIAVAHPDSIRPTEFRGVPSNPVPIHREASMLRLLSLATAALLTAGTLTVGSPGIAGACACGAVVSNDSDTRVADEQALVAADGHTETIILRLNLQSSNDDAALVFPTPTPATASQADRGVFDDLEALSAPRDESRYTLGLPVMRAGAPATGQAPSVLAQVQLGPVEATTLAGGDLTGVRQWLGDHGYTMRPEVVAHLDPYLQQGWSFVAMRLTGSAPLNGTLPPVKLVFASDKLVYPMRLSAAARTSQRVLIYTLAPHRTQRDDPDAASEVTEIDYAGSIAGRGHDPTLVQLAAAAPYLTRMTVTIYRPEQITSDFVFVPAPGDEAHQSVTYHNTDISAFVLVGAVLLGLALAGAVIVVVRRRRRAAPR